MLLAASLNKQNEMWCFIELHFNCRWDGIRIPEWLLRLLFTTTFTFIIIWLTPLATEFRKKRSWPIYWSCFDIGLEELLTTMRVDASRKVVGLTILYMNCKTSFIKFCSSLRTVVHDFKCRPCMVKFFNFNVKRFEVWGTVNKSTLKEQFLSV